MEAKLNVLGEAYRLAKKNNGAPGIDGQSFKQIEAEGVGIEEHLGETIPLDIPFVDEQGRRVTLVDEWLYLPEKWTDDPQRCEQAGITFIGPSSETISRLGDKITSKRIAEEADVPVVPWNGGPVEDVEEMIATYGQLPLPPYFVGTLEDPGRYQTMFAQTVGSAAAPTASPRPVVFFHCFRMTWPQPVVYRWPHRRCHRCHGYKRCCHPAVTTASRSCSTMPGRCTSGPRATDSCSSASRPPTWTWTWASSGCSARGGRSDWSPWGRWPGTR